MWQVQTEGYQDGEGMLIGVVSHGGVLDASPDGEYISSGLNTKGCDAVALGRQGNFFHWGFAASPTYMTEDAKLVLVNAIHYIHKFDGAKAFVKKDAPLTLSSLDDMLYGLSDKGFAAWEAMLEEHRIEEAERKAKLKERLENGEELTTFEKRMLEMPPFPDYTRDEMVRLAPEPIQKEFGQDWNRYIEFYTANRDYLYIPPAEGRPLYEFHVDEDVKQLGISNRDIKLLEKCIEMLAEVKSRELGLKLLKRYTNQEFATAESWAKWLEANRDYLFFSEAGGFQFLVDITRAGETPSVTSTSSKLMSVEEFKSHIAAVEVDEPERGKPVKFTCDLVPVRTDAGERYRLTVKAKVLEGWHIYAEVPRGQPYTTTSFDAAISEGYRACGEWETTPPQRYIGEPGVLIWEGDCKFTLDIEQIDRNANPIQVKLTVAYQACDDNSCMRPTKKTFDLPVR